ncbi:glycosyltransferase family 39 protein [Clostridium arbusti]|uniref:glycosyltransferase family 39 protein n=1 Tax=Clostridium arbusti TaxID=1137848 RepID=UPI0002886807|nr:glycosyltransferase family 39 protein [Clostridium arbusti]
MFNLKDENISIKILLFASCLILFFLILISILYYGNNTLLGNFYEPNNDDVKFIRSAWNLVQTGVYTYHKPPVPTVFMMPGLSYTLAFFMSIFGKFGGITAFRITQGAIQVLSLLLLFFIARKVFNSKVAIVAIIMDLIYIPEIWVPNLILTETFFKFFVLCLVYFSIYAIDKDRTKFYLLGGAALGFATLFRPTISTYPVIILIIWIIKKLSFKKAVKYTLTVTVVFCIVLSPWWIRNYKTFNKFIPFTLATGNPMLQGTFINYDQTTKSTDGLDYTHYNTKNPKLSEIQRNTMEMVLSKYRLESLFPKEPLKFIRWYTIGKSKIQVRTPFYWKNIFNIKYKIVEHYHYIILILSLAGAILYFLSPNKNILGILPIATVVYFILIYLPFFTMSRYFYPVMPILIMFSSYIFVSIFENIPFNKKISF